MNALLIAWTLASLLVMPIYGWHIYQLRQRMEWQEGMPTNRKPKPKKKSRGRS